MISDELRQAFPEILGNLPAAHVEEACFHFWLLSCFVRSENHRGGYSMKIIGLILYELVSLICACLQDI